MSLMFDLMRINEAYENMQNVQNVQTEDFEIEDGVLVKYHGSAPDVVIPDGVIGIGNEAFLRCTSLKTIAIPDGVRIIGREAFEYCTSLTSLTIPNSVTGIDVGAFAGCELLTTVTIPDSVTGIGGWAFAHCKSLTSITIPDTITYIGGRAFYNCTSLTSIYVKGDVEHVKDVIDEFNPKSVKYVKPLTSVDEAMSIDDILKQSDTRKAKEDEERIKREESEKAKRLSKIIVTDIDDDNIYYTLEFADGRRSDEQMSHSNLDEDEEKRLIYTLRKSIGRRPTDGEIALAELRRALSGIKYPVEWSVNPTVIRFSFDIDDDNDAYDDYYRPSEDYLGRSRAEVDAMLDAGIRLPLV